MKKMMQTATYYFAAFLQGYCLVVFPGASFIWMDKEWGALSGNHYGLLFFPMVVAAIFFSFRLKDLKNRFGVRPIYMAGILANALYLFLLYSVTFTAGKTFYSFWLLITANLALGTGFGLLLSILNILIIELYPLKRDTALTGLHAMLGTGAALAPKAVTFLYENDSWQMAVLVPIFLFALVLLISFAFGIIPKQASSRITTSDAKAKHEPMALGARLFLLVVLLYGCVEAIVGNWTISYLSQEKNFSLASASSALSAFWLAMTFGRIVGSLLAAKIDAVILYRISPFVIFSSFLLVIYGASEHNVFFLYLLLGLGCSYFFPFSISLSTRLHEKWRESLSSLMLGALMAGVGIGSSAVGYFKGQDWIQLKDAFLFAMFLTVAFGVMAVALTAKTKPVAVRNS